MKKHSGSESTLIRRSFQGCLGLHAPQLRKCPRPCSISGVCYYYIVIIIAVQSLRVLLICVQHFRNSMKTAIALKVT